MSERLGCPQENGGTPDRPHLEGVHGQDLHGRRHAERRLLALGSYAASRLRTASFDDATAQAISASSAWYFVTDARPVGSVVCVWENPFLVGERNNRSTARFDSSGSATETE
jgi:hypothetical protein